MRHTTIILLLTAFIVQACKPSTSTKSIENNLADTIVKPNIQKDEDDSENPKYDQQVYTDSYKNILSVDTTFKDSLQHIIHLKSKFYCLFDNGIIIPAKLNYADTTKTFVTHNFAQDILIIYDKDTIYNDQITKETFLPKLYEGWRSYATILYPYWSYDNTSSKFKFSYSVIIPLTDLGAGMQIEIDNTGQTAISDR